MAVEVAGGPNGVDRATDSNQPVTTATFNAPAESLLVAQGTIHREGTVTSGTMSGGSLTWTLQVGRSIPGQWGYGVYLGIWTAPVPTARSMTAALSPVGGSGTFTGALKVWIVTGADLAEPVGATNSGQTTTRNATVNAYTATQDGSLGFCTVQDWGEIWGSLTSTDPGWIGSQNYVMALYKDAPAQAGQTVTFHMNITGSGGGSALWHWAAAEIVPPLEGVLGVRLVAVGSTAVHRAATW